MSKATELWKFDRKTTLDFIEKYQLALENDKKSFLFKKNEIDVNYAKYMIEFLKTKIKLTA